MAYIKQNWINGETIATAERMKHIEDGIEDLYNAIFPVGQIVIKGDNEDYSNWLGFTWERTAVGKVLVGIDSTDTDFNTIGKTGGEKTHTLTINEMPSHNHMGKTYSKNYNAGKTIPKSRAYARSYVDNDTALGVWKYSGGKGVSGAEITDMIETSNSGGNTAHSIMNPYQVVAYWKRIA